MVFTTRNHNPSLPHQTSRPGCPACPSHPPPAAAGTGGRRPAWHPLCPPNVTLAFSSWCRRHAIAFVSVPALAQMRLRQRLHHQLHAHVHIVVGRLGEARAKRLCKTPRSARFAHWATSRPRPPPCPHRHHQSQPVRPVHCRRRCRTCRQTHSLAALTSSVRSLPQLPVMTACAPLALILAA